MGLPLHIHWLTTKNIAKAYPKEAGIHSFIRAIKVSKSTEKII
jgi:hypothetical protein